MSSIRISQLNDFSTIKSEDFVPLVDSSSLTTYRVTVTAFGDWLSASGSAVSASYADKSIVSTSSSWASSSIVSDTASYLIYPNSSTASYGMYATSASWANSSSISLLSVSTTGTASYANNATSASYAGRSTLASTASYYNFNIGIPPFADTCTSASWASASISASWAESASWAQSSSFAGSASYLIGAGGGAITKQFNNLGGSWWVHQPGAAFAVGNDLYVFNKNGQTSKRNVTKIDMQTNIVTFKNVWPVDVWNWYGRPFRRSEDNSIRVLTYTSNGLYDYNVDTNTFTHFNGTNGNVYDLPVKVLDWSNASRPDVLCLNGSVHAGSYGDTDSFRWRRTYYSGGWNDAYAAANLNIKDVINNTELRKFFNYSYNPTKDHNAFMWDFNYIKNRYYLMSDDTGYIHIFTQTTGDIYTSWLATSLTYEKTIALPMVHAELSSDQSTEKLIVDYDIDTGEEKGVIHIRRGNTGFAGSVQYINWPEFGNW